MLESSVLDEKRNTFGGGDEEISQTGNEIGEILLNKQFICEAVTKVKDVKQDTVLENSDFEATVATLEDMINILDNRHFDKKGKSEEIISQLKIELHNAKSFVKDLHGHLQKLIAIVETVKEHF